MAVNFQIVSEISIKEKSRVYLITIDRKPPFYVLKRYYSDSVKPAFEQLRNISSSFFPQMIDLWCENGEVCIIEEYVAGRTLREIMDEGGVTISEAVHFMIMMCEAMGILHDHKPKLVHRDIKPENIIIDEAGRLKLIDFDSMRVYKSEAYCDTVLMGTREYAAPEQFGFQQTDERSDIYSAGSIFKELIRNINGDKGAAHKLSKIIDKATMFDPEKRYRSAEQMLHDIKQIDKRGLSVWKCVVPAAVAIILLAGAFLWSNIRNSILKNTFENTGKHTEEMGDIEQDAETETYKRVLNLGGSLYCWNGDHWSFWGFEDGYAYPNVYYILDELEGSPVTEIGDWALGGKKELRELYVPASVTFIGEYAFDHTDIVFYGESGSYIEEYCSKNGLQFIEAHWAFRGIAEGSPVPNEHYIPAELDESPVTEIGT